MNAENSALTHLMDAEHEADTRPLDFGIIRRLFSYTTPYATRRNILFILVIIRSVQLPALTWVITMVIKGPIQEGNFDGVIWGVAGFLTLAFSTQVVFHFRQRLSLELGESVVYDLRNDIFRHLQRLNLDYFHRTKLGRTISRITSDSENVRIGVQEVLFVAMVQVGQMCTAGICMCWYDWFLFSVVLALAPILWTINRHFRRQLSQAHRAVQESFSRVTATLAESVNGIRVTQAFVRQEKNTQLFQELVQNHANNHIHVAHTQGKFLPLLDLNSQCFISLLLLIGGYRVLNPTIDASLGDLIGFFLMANLFFSPIALLGLQYTQALTSMAAAERVFRLLDTEPSWKDDVTAHDVDDLEGAITFRDISFEYDIGRPVLKNVSFSAQPGQTIALVGHTGSGKTTISNLLAKFYLPNQGAILVDGRDLREITTTSWKRQIGIVVQQSFLFTGSVLDNIRFSRPEASDENVRDAISQLDCLDIVEGLAEGFDTQVGQRGNNLSLGQRQIVCFARALLVDPRILILDEATSSIDTLTEIRVQRALERLMKGRTSFIIAHRLSTIQKADQILVLDQGHLVESGKHVDLLAKGNIYYQLHSNGFTMTPVSAPLKP